MADTDTINLPMHLLEVRWRHKERVVPRQTRRPTPIPPRPGAPEGVAAVSRPRIALVTRLVALDAFLRRRSRAVQIASVFSLIWVVGLLDYATGPEIGLSVFYLLPVAAATWFLSLPAGMIAAGTSALVWYIADTGAGHAYSHVAIPFWNAAVRLGFFVIVGQLIWRVQALLELLRARSCLDGMTGAAQSEVFWRMAEAERKRALQYRHAFGLALIDVAGVEEVNRRSGRRTGDDLVRQVVSLLLEERIGADVVSRLGGGRFAYLLPESGRLRVDPLFPALRERLIALARERDWPVTFRFGVVLFHTPPVSIEALEDTVESLMLPGEDSSRTLRRAVWRDGATVSLEER